MRILLLTNEFANQRDHVRDALAMLGDDIVSFSGKPTVSLVEDLSIDWIVSDRNEHIIASDVLAAVEGRAVNSHPSMLPWSRGWQPIFFSVWNGEPVGVSIHKVDTGLDTGPLLFQREVELTALDTLRTAHFRCRLAILDGLTQLLPDLRLGDLRPWEQRGSGSYHSKREFEGLFDHLPSRWDSSLGEVREVSHAVRKKQAEG